MTSIIWEGRSLPARPGESLLATLTAAGVTTLGEGAGGAPRGAWCGMGACQACLVTIDGVANQRACMVKVTAGMVASAGVERMPLVAGRPGTPRRATDLPVLRPDVLVIGAGPAGLSAALVARRAGAGVLLADERETPGGQYFKQPGVAEGPPPDRQARAGAALIAQVREAGVEMRAGITVWGAFAGPEFLASQDGATLRILPRATVIASGAQEVGWPVPGWTLPGVMTTGAAQGLWRTARRVPPGRIVIAGNGPLNLQLAAELVAAGADVVALVEAAPAPGLAALGPALGMAARAPQLVAQGIGYHLRLRQAGIPVLWGALVRAIRTGLEIETDTGAVLAADTVCLGYGLAPEDALVRGLGAGSGDADAVFPAGDCTAIGGAHVAAAAGALAGAAAARHLGLQADAGRAARQLARAADFQDALWRLFAPVRPLHGHATPETIICRCEGVTAGQIAAARTDGAHSHAAVKQATRLGMGRCQGRGCAALLARLAPEVPPAGFAPRAPVRPLTIADLAN